MIRHAIQRQNEDQLYIKIQQAFTDTTFKSIIDMLEVISKLPEASIDTVVTDTLKE